MRLSMMIDLDKCVGCKACVSSCRERWDTGPGAKRDWVHDYESGERGKDLRITFYPGLCMHCEEHPCTVDCPTGATYMDKNGVVVVDPNVCIGCGNCISNCAYNARFHDAQKGIIEKCNLCAPYVAKGGQPACVTTCMADCRHFGDLDDPSSEINRLIREKNALPLETAEVKIGPKVTYAGDIHREVILQQGVVKKPEKSWLTQSWQNVTLPFTRVLLPLYAGAVIAGGIAVNYMTRTKTIQAEKKVAEQTESIERHRFGMRFLHWFNLVTWLLLLFTGVGTMKAESFAFITPGVAQKISGLFGGAASLLYFHVAWGMLWILITVPLFLLYKKGGIKAFKEVVITKDDISWLMLKPFHMVGLFTKDLPPQDKYNAGQKLFAISFLIFSSLIMATGLIMAMHIGPTWLIAVSIIVHKLAVAFTLLGIVVHFVMAAIMREERPSLYSMITGYINKAHAQHHFGKWVSEKDSETRDGK